MPLLKTINARFVLESDEFAKAYKLVLRNLPPKIKWAGLVQCGLLCALMLVGIGFQPSGKLQPISLIVVVLVWLVLVTGLIAQRTRVKLQFTGTQDKEIWYEFNENGFRSGTSNSESHVDWPGITAFLETATLFVILQSDFLFYTVPKRALAPDDASSLSNLLREKVQARTSLGHRDPT